MKSLGQLALITVLLLLWLPALADDIITNFTSPVASYQYLENIGSEVVSNGGVQSPIISYQYYEWPTNALSLQYSQTVSYYYQFLDAPMLVIVQTNRAPTTNESEPAYLISPPTSSQLMSYHGGIFTTNLASIDPSKMTVVLTHGWRDNPNTWASNMASELRSSGIVSPNIVAWDWAGVAASSDIPGITEAQTGQQGCELGAALLQTLGANYSNRIQFMGHSLGTLVNASAANYLQGTNWGNGSESPTPWPATNMLMTLFDEAEVATDLTNFWVGINLLADKDGNPFMPTQPYDHPLPRQFAWAENYISAFGLMHTNAVNVILVDGYPAYELDIESLFDALVSFHDYPMGWYEETIQTEDSEMGFIWPNLWLQNDYGFANAAMLGLVYLQQSENTPWDLVLTNWNFGTNLLAARFQSYRDQALVSIADIPEDVVDASGDFAAQAIEEGENVSWQFILTTSYAVYGSPQLQARSLGLTPDGEMNGANVPAYAWIQLSVPMNAVSMSFDYFIQGEWEDDSLAAAFNGTNILYIAGNEIQTNVVFNSGPIDVAAYAGSTNEFFIGIIGGTSTNAQLTVENLTFSILEAPSLQTQTSGGNLILSWPITAQNYGLQTTTNLADPKSWIFMTNAPAIINFESVVTNSVVGNENFYRLIMQ